LSTLRRNLLILLAVAVLTAVAIYFISPPSKTKLGLDLQGGLSMLLEAQDSAKAPRTDAAMTQAISIIDSRINKLGVVESEVQRQGQWKISVQMPGIKNPEEALAIIGKTAVLEFYEVSALGTSYATQAEALKAAGVDSVVKLPGDTRLIHWPAKAGSTTDSWFITKTQPPVTGAALSGAQVGFDTNNRPKVNFQFNTEGAKKFGELTNKMAQTAQLTGQNQLLAIVLDGEIQSAPRVQERIDGNGEITGTFTLDEAKNLALVLQTGALPVDLKVISQSEVGAVLGKASLRQALVAGAIGLLLILIFMIALYRLLGVVADIALAIYGLLFWGILNAIGVTLTLPGIAGAILTLGMAVDANVLIFARIREEVAHGKTLRTAFDAGYKKALRSILDANFSTLITAAVLFWAAAGGVRGFALTLAIGVLLSMFTAIVTVQAMLHLLAETSVFKNLGLLGLKPPTEKDS
jgi:preprotein translocase subunit SecD